MISTSEIGKRNWQAPHHWELLDLEDLKFEKPTVLCLSGSRTITNSLANGFAKHAERYLDLLLKNKDGNALESVDVIGVKYAQSEIAGYGTLDDATNEQLTLAILSLLVNPDGNKLDLEQAKKNMSRLTFFTYCAGNKELLNLLANLRQKLCLVGYSQSEINSIFGATLEVSYAPSDFTHNKIPSVRIMSLKDTTLATRIDDDIKKIAKTQLQNLDGIGIHRDEPGTLYGKTNDKALAGCIQVVSSNLLNSYSGKFCEHTIALMARDENWRIKPLYIDGVEHRAVNADCVSQIMAWALCKGVEHSIHNFNAANYLPNTYWHELTHDFQSIVKSFKQEDLADNPLRTDKKRKLRFNRLRMKQNCRETLPRYEEMVDALNNANSLDAAIAYIKQNNFIGIEHVLPAVQVLTDQEKDDILTMADIEVVR